MEDIINYSRLNEEVPGWRDLELQYRSHPATPRSDTGQAIATLAIFSLAAFIAMIAVRVIGNNFLLPQGIIVCTTIGIFAAFVIIARNRKAVRTAVLVLLSGPLVSFFIGALHYTSQMTGLMAVLTFVSLIASIWLVDRVVIHYATWLLANPALPRPIRLKRIDWFKSRWRPSRIQNLPAPDSEKVSPEIQKMRAVEVQRIRGYRRGFLVAAALYAILPHFPKDANPDVLVFFIPPIYALFRIWRTRPSRGFFAALKTSMLAFTSWLTYGIQSTAAPGVLQSPGGTLRHRTLTTALVFALVAIVICPYVGYFGFVRSVVGDRGQWKNEFDRSLQQQTSFVTVFLMAAAPDGLIQNPLTEEEQYVLDDLQTTWKTLSKSQQETRTKLELKISNATWYRYSAFERQFPHGWVYVALDAISRGRTEFLYPLVLNLLVCILFPFVMLWTLLAAIGAGVLTHTRLAVDIPDAPECREPTDHPTTLWEKYVSRLQASGHESEARHLWLGAHLTDDYPILLDREILSEHAYIVGDSGSGKTALGITPMLTQLIRAKDAAIVIIDLKGDNTLFQTVRQEAAQAGLTFKFFTNEMNKPTYTFNPFRQGNPDQLSLNQVCETMLEALNLNHGEGYGRSYYSRVARRWLSAILKSYPNIDSFDDLYKLTKASENFRDEKERQDAFELIAVVESLASFQQLNITAKPGRYPGTVSGNAIHMPDVIAQRQIVYFWLPAALEAASVREIAKLALYSLLNSAYWHVVTQGKAAQTYLVIDEFQRIASENFKIVLEQARSMGVGAILANQTFADLKTNDTDLRPTVQTNTRFKQVFSATDLDQQLALMTASGERFDLRYSWTKSSEGTSSVSASQVVVPRLLRNDIIEISDAPLGSIVHVSRGSGYTQFSGYMTPVRAGWSITKADYDKRAAMPWPEPSESTITVTRPPLEADAFPSAERRIEVGRVFLDTKARPAKKTADAPAESGATPGNDWASRLESLAEAQSRTLENLRAPQKPASEDSV